MSDDFLASWLTSCMPMCVQCSAQLQFCAPYGNCTVYGENLHCQLIANVKIYYRTGACLLDFLFDFEFRNKPNDKVDLLFNSAQL